MRRLLDLRITHWGWKLAYVVAAYVLPMPGPVSTAIGMSDGWFAVISAVWTIAAVLYGARIFRGRGEPVAPARPWWQMTARPKLSRNLGLVFAVATAYSLLGLTLQLAGISEPTASTVAVIFTVIEFGALAFLYLNSAVRLRRAGVGSTEPARPTFKPKRLTVG